MTKKLNLILALVFTPLCSFGLLWCPTPEGSAPSSTHEQSNGTRNSAKPVKPKTSDGITQTKNGGPDATVILTSLQDLLEVSNIIAEKNYKRASAIFDDFRRCLDWDVFSKGVNVTNQVSQPLQSLVEFLKKSSNNTSDKRMEVCRVMEEVGGYFIAELKAIRTKITPKPELNIPTANTLRINLNRFLIAAEDIPWLEKAKDFLFNNPKKLISCLAIGFGVLVAWKWHKKGNPFDQLGDAIDVGKDNLQQIVNGFPSEQELQKWLDKFNNPQSNTVQDWKDELDVISKQIKPFYNRAAKVRPLCRTIDKAIKELDGWLHSSTVNDTDRQNFKEVAEKIQTVITWFYPNESSAALPGMRTPSRTTRQPNFASPSGSSEGSPARGAGGPTRGVGSMLAAATEVGTTMTEVGQEAKVAAKKAGDLLETCRHEVEGLGQTRQAVHSQMVGFPSIDLWNKMLAALKNSANRNPFHEALYREQLTQIHGLLKSLMGKEPGLYVQAFCIIEEIEKLLNQRTILAEEAKRRSPADGNGGLLANFINDNNDALQKLHDESPGQQLKAAERRLESMALAMAERIERQAIKARLDAKEVAFEGIERADLRAIDVQESAEWLAIMALKTTEKQAIAGRADLVKQGDELRKMAEAQLTAGRQDIKESVEKLSSKLTKILENKVGEVIGTINHLGEQTIKMTAEQVAGVRSEVTKTIENLVQLALTKLDSQVSAGREDIKLLVQELANKLTEQIAGARTNITALGDKAITTADTQATNLRTILQREIREAVEKILSQATNMPGAQAVRRLGSAADILTGGRSANEQDPRTFWNTPRRQDNATQDAEEGDNSMPGLGGEQDPFLVKPSSSSEVAASPPNQAGLMSKFINTALGVLSAAGPASPSSSGGVVASSSSSTELPPAATAQVPSPKAKEKESTDMASTADNQEINITCDDL